MRKRLFRMAVIVVTVLTLVFGNTIQAIACTQIYLGNASGLIALAAILALLTGANLLARTRVSRR
jgi:hypothetical protein